jgi:hypothetical protein
MGLFKRPRPPSVPDADLPLSVDEAVALRILVRNAFAESGMEVVVLPDHVVDDQGRQFGLWNLAAMCKTLPERDWPAAVAKHVSNLVRPSEDLASMSQAELETCTYLRLVERAGLRNPEWHPNAARIGEDMLALLSVDLPETVSTPGEDSWVQRGGLDHWLGIGRANLLALLVGDELQHERIEVRDGGSFDVAMGDSFFTASTALLIEELVRRFDPHAETPHGVLVATPFRHQVAWRVIDGTTDSALALNNLFRFALLGFADAPGPLSQNVHWVCGNEWTPVTAVVEGQPQVHVSEELAAALGGRDPQP